MLGPDLSSSSTGILAVWNDCAAGSESLYEHWYLTEQLPEMLAIPGFAAGRWFRAVDADRQFLTTYEVDSPSVLASTVYTDRLAATTTLRREITADGFIHASRTVYERRDVLGSIRGAVIVTVQVRDGDATATASTRRIELDLDPDIVHSESWVVATPGKQSSPEQDQRKVDERASRCLLFEFLDIESALRVTAAFRRAQPEAEVRVFRLMGAMQRVVT